VITETKHLTKDELEAGLDEIRRSPKDEGPLLLIVRRPRIEEREVLNEGVLDLTQGLVGDSWPRRGSSKTADGGPQPDMQINIMNARAAALVAQDKDRWQLAGDQLYIDLDMSEANLPAGSRIAIGSAVIEVTPPPHTGCAKFVSRFGLEAMKFVNSAVGRELHLRGINAKVVQSGTIRVGDVARKIANEE
jgi:MOSC domain-containing protein